MTVIEVKDTKIRTSEEAQVTKAKNFDIESILLISS